MRIANTIQEVMELRLELGTHYSALHQEFREDEKFATLDFADKLRLPAEFQEDAVVLPTAIEMVDNAVNHVAPALRRVFVPRVSTSERATNQATTLKDYYSAQLTKFEREGIENPYRALIRMGSIYGMMPVKIMYNPASIPMEPIQEEGESGEDFKIRMQDYKDKKDSLVPIRLEILHPTEVLPDPWSTPPTFVIQVTNVRVAKAISLYPEFKRGSLRLTDEVEVIEYHDDEVRTLFIDTSPKIKAADKKVLVPVLSPRVRDEGGFVKHGLGMIPYSIHGIGSGMRDSENKPLYKYVGALRHTRSLLISESKGFSLDDIVLNQNAFPFRAAEGENTDQMEDFKFEAGTVKSLPPGVRIVDIRPLSTSPDIRAHTFEASSRLERAALPRSLRGVQDPGVSTGFQQQLLQLQGQLRYTGLIEAFERVLEDVCRTCAQIIERKVSGPVKLIKDATEDEFVSVSAGTFRGHRAVRVKINATDPEDEIRKHQDAATLVNSGMWTREYGISKVSPDVDPRKMLSGILAENIVFSQPIMGILAQFFAQQMSQELSLEDLLDQILGAADGGGTPTPEARTFSERTPASQTEDATGTGSRQDQAALRELDLRELG